MYFYKCILYLSCRDFFVTEWFYFFCQLGDNNIFTGYIPVEELDITYSTSSGPGGQNVNKVNTKVDLRFKVESAQWLNEEIRQKLIDIVSQ